VANSLDKAKLRTAVILFSRRPFDRRWGRYPNRESERGQRGRERVGEGEQEKWCLVCQPSSPPHFFTSGPPRRTLTFVGGAGGRAVRVAGCLHVGAGVWVCVCVCVRSADAKDRTSPRGVCVYCRDPVGGGGGDGGRPCRAERPCKRPLLDERRL